VLVSGTKATFSSGLQGFKKRLDSHSERELLDHLEIADELPGTVGPEAAMSVARPLNLVVQSCANQEVLCVSF